MQSHQLKIASLPTIKRAIKFKRYVDYNFTSDSCLYDYG